MSDRAEERRWLEWVADVAALPDPVGFVDAALQRLNKGALEYGEDAWRGRSFAELVDEALEEGVDFGGWLVWADRIINASGELPVASRTHLRQTLVEATAKVLEGWAILRMVPQLHADLTVDRPQAPPNERPYSPYFEE